jgi:hypothetical protein
MTHDTASTHPAPFGVLVPSRSWARGFVAGLLVAGALAVFTSSESTPRDGAKQASSLGRPAHVPVTGGRTLAVGRLR